MKQAEWVADSEKRGLGGCYLEAKSVLPTLNKKKKMVRQAGFGRE